MTKQYLQTCWNEVEAPKAYVLINLTQGSENQVIKDVKALGSLKMAYRCFGMYDLILKIEPDSFDDLKELIAHKYRTIKGIQSILVPIITEVISEKNFKEDKRKLKILSADRRGRDLFILRPDNLLLNPEILSRYFDAFHTPGSGRLFPLP